MRWKYDFNASGCWIVDEEGFTVVGHMPITVEQCQVIVMEHNAMLDRLTGDGEPPAKDHEIFAIVDGNRRSVWIDKAGAEILLEYGLIFLESGNDKWMADPNAYQLKDIVDQLSFIEGVIWANDH